jgi:hypothetical protein
VRRPNRPAAVAGDLESDGFERLVQHRRGVQPRRLSAGGSAPRILRDDLWAGTGTDATRGTAQSTVFFNRGACELFMPP